MLVTRRTKPQTETLEALIRVVKSESTERLAGAASIGPATGDGTSAPTTDDDDMRSNDCPVADGYETGPESKGSNAPSGGEGSHGWYEH